MSPLQVDTPSAESGRPFLKRFTPVLTFVALCWLMFVINNVLLGGSLNRYGIVPRHTASVAAILWAPFLHGSFQHLLANTIPLLVLGTLLSSRSHWDFVLVSAVGIVVGGGLIWLFARNASHIGASGVIFCYFGYLASLAYFRRTFGTFLIAAICIVAYGGMLKGLLPKSNGVSWEGHLAGFVTGISIAWLTSKVTPKKDLVADAKPPEPVDLPR